MTMRRLIIVGLLALAGAASGACGAASPVIVAGPKPAPRIATVRDVDKQLGQRVHVVGEATNTDHGPSIVSSNLVVYMEDLRSWSGPVVGKRVEAVGVIGRDTSGFVRVVNGEPMVFLKNASYLLVE